MIKEFFRRYGATRTTGGESNAYRTAATEFLRDQIRLYEAMRGGRLRKPCGGRFTQEEFVELGRTLSSMKAELFRRGEA